MGLPPATGPITFGALVLFGLYMAWEIWRWVGGNRSMLTPGQFRRRLAGGILLELSMLLWFLANPLMQGRPVRDKVLYLLVAMLCAVIPMLLAVREAAFVVRQYVRWRGELVRDFERPEVPRSEDQAPRNGKTREPLE